MCTLRALLCVSLFCLLSSRSGLAEERLLVTGVRVFDPETETLSEPQDILIVGERIEALGQDLKGERTIDGAGRYAISGMFDSHTHLAMLATMGESKESKALRAFVEAGITHVRDVGGPVEALEKLSRSTRKGERLGPEIFYTGPMLERSPLTWGSRNSVLPGFTVAIDSKEDVDRVLADDAAHGATLIKTFNKFDADVYRHLVEVAGKMSLRIVHDPGTPLFHEMPMDRAVELGVRSIEHAKAPWPVVLTDELQEEHDALLAKGASDLERGPFMLKVAELGLDSIDEEKLEKLYDLMLEKEAFFCPTIQVFEQMKGQGGAGGPQAKITDALVEVSGFFVEQAADFGVRMLVGQDGVHPSGTLNEIRLLAEHGVSSAEILKGLTIYPAMFLGVTDRLGSVAAGKEADLVLLDEDPLEDANHLASVSLVVQRGKVVFEHE